MSSPHPRFSLTKLQKARWAPATKNFVPPHPTPFICYLDPTQDLQILPYDFHQYSKDSKEKIGGVVGRQAPSSRNSPLSLPMLLWSCITQHNSEEAMIEAGESENPWKFLPFLGLSMFEVRPKSLWSSVYASAKWDHFHVLPTAVTKDKFNQIMCATCSGRWICQTLCG